MEVHSYLIQLVAILLSARLMGEIAVFLRIPPVIGELCAGLIIGPSLLGWIETSDFIYLLAQIGIILLLFEVGIETDINRLKSSGKGAIVVAIAGVILPFVLGFILSRWIFDLSLLISLFISCTLTVTSIGITLRVLRDIQQQNSNEAQIIIGAAVLDDVIGIVLLSMLYEFAIAGEINFLNTGKVILFIAIFFLIAPIAAKAVSHVVRKWNEKTKIPGILPTMIVSLILLFSWFAHLLGAPELLGGFAAGLALSRQFFLPFAAFLHEREPHNFSQQVEDEMRPIIHLFTPIFFVAIGLSLNLREIDWSSPFLWSLGGGLIFVAILGKLASGFFLTRAKPLSKLIIGLAMIPRGEVGLIFANVGLSLGVLKNDVYATVILVIVVTTLFTPFFLRGLFAKAAQN